ncbi:MAG: 50S ribosomal protein L3 [Patescibacteria group bacterium]
MKFILGTKQEMVQLFDEKGNVHAGTIVSAGPVVVTQVKTAEKDGYEALQLGYGVQKESRLSKAEKGHLKDLPLSRVLRETRLAAPADAALARGTSIDLSSFAEGDPIEVTGISKAKGFQGTVKRHGFHGGPRTHGQKHSEREPGSIGAGGYQRVFKGRRMSGRMGGDQVTVKNLRVLKVDAATNTMIISGAVPGRRGTLLAIKGK